MHVFTRSTRFNLGQSVFYATAYLYHFQFFSQATRGCTVIEPQIAQPGPLGRL